MKNQASSINLNSFQKSLFHFLFIFILSSQVFFTNYYLNTVYVLGLMLFIRADFEYDWKLILLIAFYGFYQDTLLGFQFGFSSMVFLFFFFFGQISNLISGIGSFLINIYFLTFGIFLLAVLEGLYLYFSYNISIDLYKIFTNMTLLIILYLFLKRFFNFLVESHA